MHDAYSMVLLPDFDEHGLLPAGDYRMTLADLRTSRLVTGPDLAPDGWDRPWRAYLVENLAVLAGQLWQVGIGDVFIDGSFVEAKPHPNDIDGYFECDPARLPSLVRQLNALDPFGVWTWAPESRRLDRASAKRQLPMWHQYRVELYPHFNQLSGIRDRYGHELMFPSAFRMQRGTGLPKGIIQFVQT